MENKNYYGDIFAFLEERPEDIADFDAFEEFIETEDGKALLHQCVELFDLMKNHPKEVYCDDFFYVLALDYINEKNYQRAVDCCKEVLNEQPENIRILYLVMIIFLMLVDFENVCKTLTKMNKIDREGVQKMHTSFYEDNALKMDLIFVMTEKWNMFNNTLLEELRQPDLSPDRQTFLEYIREGLSGMDLIPKPV
ncbi:hypothetical protein ACFL43_01880 [Thermodesulfobacteriota bacterium]